MDFHKRSSIAARAVERKIALRKSLLEKHPSLCSPTSGGSDLVLGHDEHGRAVTIENRLRTQHILLSGSTGSGKSKWIESAVRQDILAGHGTILIDPHGNHPDSCYRSILSWMGREGLLGARTVHLVDPNIASHISGFNPLAMPDAGYDPAVIADAVLECIERLWGEEDTNSKPTLQRVLTAAVTALCELGLTLNELRFLLEDPEDENGVRAWMIGQLRNEVARAELRWLDNIAKEPRGRSEFRLETTGPRNRFAKLLHLDSLALTVGQRESGIDFRAALDEQHVILINLAPGPRLSDKAGQMLGRLMLRMLFFHAQRRIQPDRLCYLYCDEAALFLSNDVARFLSEIRKYGVGCILATQTLAHFRQAGPELLDVVKANTNLKLIFRSRDPEQAAELAEMVVPLDLERPVAALVKPAVVGHRIRRLNGETQGQQISTTLSRGSAHSQGRTIGSSRSRTASVSQTLSQGYGTSMGGSVSEGWGASRGFGEAVGSSNSESSGTSSGTSETESFAPPPQTLFGGQGEPALRGTTRGASAGKSRSEAHATSSSQSHSRARSQTVGQGASWNVSRNFSRARGWSEMTGRTESISKATTDSVSTSVGRSSGISTGASSQEALEPIYRDLPSAVHSIENVRYAAATAVRSLTTGQAIVSFVDNAGLQTSIIHVPHVEGVTLDAGQFDHLRARVLDASPSALPTDQARQHIEHRAQVLIAAAKSRVEAEEVTYRNRRKGIAQECVDAHGEPRAQTGDPVKGPDRQRRRPVGRP